MLEKTKQKAWSRYTPNKIVYLVLFINLTILPAGWAVVPEKYLPARSADSYTLASIAKVIESGRLEPAQLAIRYHERGSYFESLRQFDHALRDYTKALFFDPSLTKVYLQRAVVHAHKEHYQKAYADIAHVLNLNPNNADSYKTRGMISFFLRRYENAAADFRRYLKIKPNDIYRVLWLFLSEYNSNPNKAYDIEEITNGAKLQEWPGPLIEVYLGNITAEGLINAIRANSSRMHAGHLCEAYFYIGQYYLVNGSKRQALQYFDKAVKTKMYEYIEYQFSVYYKNLLMRGLKKNAG